MSERKYPYRVSSQSNILSDDIELTKKENLTDKESIIKIHYKSKYLMDWNSICWFLTWKKIQGHLYTEHDNIDHVSLQLFPDILLYRKDSKGIWYLDIIYPFVFRCCFSFKCLGTNDGSIYRGHDSKLAREINY